MSHVCARPEENGAKMPRAEIEDRHRSGVEDGLRGGHISGVEPLRSSFPLPGHSDWGWTEVDRVSRVADGKSRQLEGQRPGAVADRHVLLSRSRIRTSNAPSEVVKP